eukprot:5019133-Amphidinium_carterae.1
MPPLLLRDAMTQSSSCASVQIDKDIQKVLLVTEEANGLGQYCRSTTQVMGRPRQRWTAKDATRAVPTTSLGAFVAGLQHMTGRSPSKKLAGQPEACTPYMICRSTCESDARRWTSRPRIQRRDTLNFHVGSSELARPCLLLTVFQSSACNGSQYMRGPAGDQQWHWKTTKCAIRVAHEKSCGRAYVERRLLGHLDSPELKAEATTGQNEMTHQGRTLMSPWLVPVDVKDGDGYLPVNDDPAYLPTWGACLHPKCRK